MRRNLGQRGAILPLVAICLAVLMGFAGMAVDVGYLQYQQRQQQNATDAAAIGGAQTLAFSNCGNSGAATTAAQSDSASNGFANAGNVTVMVQNPPLSGPLANNNCAVMVTVNNSHTQTFFSKLFGWANGMPETTSAAGLVTTNANGCVYLLDPAGSPNFNGAKISAPGCGILMNGSPVFHGGTIDFSYIGYASSLTDHGTNYVEASPTSMLAVADPCREISGCSYLTNNPPTASGCAPLVVTGPTVNPGCYSSISGNGSFTMNPGLYVFTGSNSLNGANITGTGVTLYVTSTGTGLDFHGTKVNLTACTTSCTNGAVANVLYYQVPANASSLDISGPAGVYAGLIYAPKSNVTVNGNAGSGHTLMVFGDWTLNGTGQGMTFNPPPAHQSLIKQAVLAQ